jgi:DEAD/DEAH box helicase domain-containing protein
MIPNPANPALEAARAKLIQFWNGLDLPCEQPGKAVACGNVNDHSLTLRYWWPSELANSTSFIPPSPGFVIFDDAHLQDEPERHMAWRRWLWLFNIYQTLPGVLLATRAGLDAGDHSSLNVSMGASPASGAQGAAHAAAWEIVIEQAMSLLSEGLHSLMIEGLPPPDEVGYELDLAGEVVAESELAWKQCKLVLLMQVHISSAKVWEANNWKTIVAEGEWQQQLADALNNCSSQQ